MNDIEKLSASTKQLLALQSVQESARKIRKRANINRAAMEGVPVSELSNLTPLTGFNTLPDNNDGQDNLLPRGQFETGIIFTVSPWPNTELFGFDLFFAIDDEPFPDTPITVLPDFVAFEHTLPISQGVRITHGVHKVTWKSISHESSNPEDGPPLEFFIDIVPPHLTQQPDRVLLPGGLPDGDITEEYLETEGGVTFTLPEYLDPRPGDVFSFYINSMPFITEQAVDASREFTVPAADFERVQEGQIRLTYYLIDRAGNRSVESLDTLVYLIKSPVPSLRAPIIDQGPDISLDDARNGVIVVHDFDTYLPGDVLSVYWNGIGVDSILYPTPSFLVPFSVIKSVGDSYQGNVHYVLNRSQKPYQSPPTSITVDLEVIGPDPDPDKPDEIVNPNLAPLVLTSSSGAENVIAPVDKGEDADIVVPLYTPVNIGEVVEVYYGSLANTLGATSLVQLDIDKGNIDVTAPWSVIDAVGNGLIDVFYRIYPAGKPENAQQSPMTPVQVTVHDLQALPLASFPDRIVNGNVINCTHYPWDNGVNVRFDYPEFQADDMITLNFVLDSTRVAPSDPTVPTNPIPGSEREFQHRVTPIEASNGFAIINVLWEHISAITRGCLVVDWTLKRGEINGSSGKHFVRYDRVRSSGAICPEDD